LVLRSLFNPSHLYDWQLLTSSLTFGGKIKGMEVGEFYDKISKEYADLLDKTIPRYREMLSSLLHYIPNHLIEVGI